MEEFVKQFGIDSRLLLAQIVNFTVLLILLKKFAYGPILKMMRERREKIEEGMEMRKNAEIALRESGEIRERTLQQANKEALEVVGRAEALGRERQDEIVKDTDKKVEGIIAEARRIIDADKANMRIEIESEAEELIRLGLGSVLGKMMPGERDRELIKEAIGELKKV